MLSLPLTHASRNCAHFGVSEPKRSRSSILKGSLRNFRIVSVGPDTASGGMIAFTREPSGRRASTIGDASSTRRPIREMILSMIRRRCWSSTNAALGLDDLAAALDVDVARAVHHDLGDGVVAQERLERPVAEDVVGDLARDLRPLLAGERGLVERDRLVDGLADALGELDGALRLGPREQPRPDPRDHVMVDPALEVAERVDRDLLGLVDDDRGGNREVVAAARRPGVLPDWIRDWRLMRYAAFRILERMLWRF